MAWNPRQWWSERRRELEKSAGAEGECGPLCARSRAGGERFMIASVKEIAEATVDTLLHHDRQHGNTQEEEDRLARARECTDAGVKAGVKAGATACVVSAIPTLIAVRTLPWAKYNLNYTAQALIVSATTIGAYFITTEKTIMACSRDASYARLEKEREAKGL